VSFCNDNATVIRITKFSVCFLSLFPVSSPVCRHHVEDIMAGFLLGLVMAFLFYRTAYAPLLSPQSGCLLETGSLKAAASTSNGGMRNTSRPELAGLRSGSLNGEPLYEYQMADKV
jgi:hypothetical protein